MRTFERWQWCKFPNNELKVAAYDYAKLKGVPVFESFGRNNFDVFDGLVMNNEGRVCGKDCSNCTNAKEEITIAQFFEYCDNWRKLNPSELQLNDEYRAVINKECKTVNVGCHYFSFDKINELHKLINQ